MTKYRSSQVDLNPAYVYHDTIDWCVQNKCPNYVKTDFLNCARNSIKQEKRNNLDDSIIKEDIGDKIINITMSAWNWIF